MPKNRFFSIQETESITQIFESIPNGSLLILDIDETIARGKHQLGLDAWFRLQLAELQGAHPDDKALSSAINLYNMAQLASHGMTSVDPNNPVAPLLPELRAQGISIIGLTARNQALSTITVQWLQTLGVVFEQDLLQETQFNLNERTVTVKNGIIFADGSNKGCCIKYLHEHDPQFSLTRFSQTIFVDDSLGNCKHVSESLTELDVDFRVFHYQYTAKYHVFNPKIAEVQKKHLLLTGSIPSDEQADEYTEAEYYLPF